MSFFQIVDQNLRFYNKAILAAANQYKKFFHIFGIALFFGGFIWSISIVDIEPFHVKYNWIIINLILFSPLAILINSFNLHVISRVSNIEIDYKRSLHITSLSTVSNLLPIPAGTLVQTSMLSGHGSSPLITFRTIVVGNLCSLAIIIFTCGYSIMNYRRFLGVLLVSVGLTIILLSTVYFFKIGGLSVSLQFLFLRILRAVLAISRVMICFLAFSVTLSPQDAVIFTGAGELGTLLVIFPAGLGASEVIASFFAALLGHEVAVAFIALGVNRILGISAAVTIWSCFLVSSDYWKK